MIVRYGNRMAESVISQRLDNATGTSTPHAPGARRRHRPREETKQLLLNAATRVAIARVSSEGPEGHNVLADIRIAHVLAEVNAGIEPSTTYGRMTTGAFYQIWADQAAFQRELLAHVMDQIATPGADEVEKLALDLVSDNVPASEIFRQISDADFRVTRQSPQLFLALGLGALAPAEMVRDAQATSNEKYIASVDHLLTALLRYAGRRLLPERTIEDLIWATEALAVGYLLRARTHPEIPERTDRNGWSARASAYLGVVYAFTEPTPTSS
jgi:hypothetical protein